jgi:hypothetical protein
MDVRWTMNPITRPRPRLDPTGPTPIPCGSADVIVVIDGAPYAGFVNRAYAEMAVGLWSGEIDGNGNPIPWEERPSRRWPAIRGKVLAIVERSHRHDTRW